MKSPWFTLAAICALVLGIVLFCIVFGGYSSLLRSQNRIKAVKDRLVSQCQDQLALVTELVDAAGPDTAPEQTAGLSAASGTATQLIDRIRESEDPVAQALILSYGDSQALLNRRITELVQALAESGNGDETDLTALEKRLNETQAAIYITGKRYNKEARYFNTRTRVFPVGIIARLFSLDKVYFSEITLDPPASAPGKEAASAS
ncbi:MAG: LemA family protein [Desulfobacter sp.]